MTTMFKLHPRFPGPLGVAIEHLFASSIAAVVFPDPALAEAGTDIRRSGRDAVIYLPALKLAIASMPIGEMSLSMQRYQFADYLGVDLLVIDLGREAGRVEVALDYGSPRHRGREPAPYSHLWLGRNGVFFIPVDTSGGSPAIQLTADGLIRCPLPYRDDAEWLDGMEAASFCAERARAAQRSADATAQATVTIV